MSRQAIVMTGLPASGKTTLGRRIATEFRLGFLDKVDFLERLYARHEVTVWEQRKSLSRQSDDLFRDAACAAEGTGVLVSHWRPGREFADTGTPTDWLSGAFDRLLEISCLCPLETAARRFQDRTRHPGHMDQARDRAAHLQWMRDLAPAYPLGLGDLIALHTGEGTVWARVARGTADWIAAGGR